MANRPVTPGGEPSPAILPFRIHTNFFNAPELDQDKSQAWLISFPSGPIDRDRGVDVVVTRTDKTVDQCTGPVLDDMNVATQRKPYHEIFNRADDVFATNAADVGSYFEGVTAGQKKATMFITASNLIVAVRRAVMLCFSEEECGIFGSVRVNLTIAYNRLDKLQVATTLQLGDADPARFNTAELQSIEHFTGRAQPEQLLDETPPTPQTAKMRTFQDQSDIVGDLGLRPASVVAESYPLDPLPDAIMPSLNDESPINNASLHVTVQPSDKYKALASMIAGMFPNGTSALIIGDHPGTLARALICRGIGVVGLDPRNHNTTEPASVDSAMYRQLRGRVRVSGGAPHIEDDSGGTIDVGVHSVYIVDTSNDDETAEESTFRNAVICEHIKKTQEAALVISQWRSAPTQPGKYAILDLPGQSNQGCEVYAVHLLDGARNFGRVSNDWQRYAWAAVESYNDDDTMELDDNEPLRVDKFAFKIAHRWLHLAAVFDNFWQKTDRPLPVHSAPAALRMGKNKTTDKPTKQQEDEVVRFGDARHWYQFVVSRAFMYADRALNTGLTSLVAGADDPLHLIARWERYLGHTLEAKPALQNIFDPALPEALTGIAPGLFRRHPQFHRLCRARYEALVSYTVYTSVDTPDNVRKLMREPASGVLLRGFSAMRRDDAIGGWHGPALAAYKRVLPYEIMACIVFEPLYQAMLHYVRACKYGLGKPMHAWELQHMLWALTTHGTDAERMMYIGTRMRGALLPTARGRKIPVLRIASDKAVTEFENGLRMLRKYELYLQIDPGWAAYSDNVHQGAFENTKRINDPMKRDLAIRHERTMSGNNSDIVPQAVSTQNLPPTAGVDTGGSIASGSAANVRGRKMFDWKKHS